MITDRALKLEIINKKIKSLEDTVDHWWNCYYRKGFSQTDDKTSLKFLLERDKAELQKWKDKKYKIEQSLLNEIENEI